MLVGALALAATFGQVAHADVDDVDASNVQEGDNEGSADQSGDAASGDAVGGQVTGVVSGGDTSVDATNRSEDVDIETGDADGFNDSASFAGLSPDVSFGAGGASATASDITDVTANNVQEGDNEVETTQHADAASGDGVGGQVIGVVTSAGGSADIVAANTSTDVDVETGDADAENAALAFGGLAGAVGFGAGGASATASDIDDVDANNVQEGDNEVSADQSANAASGDGVAGQVLGVVSAGDASIDATNLSEDVDVETGDSDAFNAAAAAAGLFGDIAFGAGGASATASDITDVDGADNVQEGDNERSVAQDADSASGDAVGGQVAGVVTSAGGSADLVLANTSLDVDSETGDSLFENFDIGASGLTADGIVFVF